MRSPHQTVTNRSETINRFFNSVYTNIDQKLPSFDPEKIQEHPLMVVCTHRSQVDYFLGGMQLHNIGFKDMRFAAGDNLTKLPIIGSIFKGFGAFTVERDIGFERNYIKKLCTKVIGMMKNRDAVIVFPEGGRSYSGSMLEIKSGIIGAAVLLQAKCPDEDVLLLPMAISYECPPDAPWFTMLLRGKKLRKKTQPFFKRMVGNVLYFGADLLAFAPFILARKTGRNYGAVYIDFDVPVAIRSLVDLSADRARDARDEFFAHRASMQKVAAFIAGRFVALYRILPLHIVAEICKTRGAPTVGEIEDAIPPLLEKLRGERRNLAELSALSPATIVDRGIKQLEKLKVISRRGTRIVIKRRTLLEYCAAPVHDRPPKPDEK
jgi:1-acyl-sn-glycerol-3-phosphate acyltransferase